MKTRSKIGNRKGNPAYRTPSTFRYQKNLAVSAQKSKIAGKFNADPARLAKRSV